MDVAEVLKRVDRIGQLVTDDEAAHGEEDDLYRDVLEEIATGNPDPVGLARVALATQEIEFHRWGA